MDYIATIREQREDIEEVERRERIIEREFLGRARLYLKYPNILAIIGVRRCGKSIFSYLLAKGARFGYVNFDDERFVGIKTEDLDKILEAIYELYGDVDYIILDEIQNVAKWELFASRLRRTKRVIITGSNSNLLAGELGTHLTGRYISMPLFPFSFGEYLDFKGFKRRKAYTTKEKAELLKLLREYLETGGFPEVYKFGRAILHRTYDDIITRDLLLRYRIKKRDDIRRIAKYLITNFSQEISYSKLAKIFNVKHVSTVSNWIFYLENCFLIFKLERFAFKLKHQFLAPKKIYCVDTGIINSIGFRFSENLGKLMENTVAVKLQMEKAMDDTKEIYYWKDHQQNEVDFVIKKGTKVEGLIQVTYGSSKEDIKEREIKALLKAGEELRCKNLSVITWDYEGEEKVRGKRINLIPFWKWLLGVKSGS
jgi:predicted AAA+ superfamily ATPase